MGYSCEAVRTYCNQVHVVNEITLSEMIRWHQKEVSTNHVKIVALQDRS